jgi:hypothetical protein
MGLKGLFRPFRALGVMWILLTQAVSLGFARSPLWGSPAHTSRLGLAGFWRATAQPVGWVFRLGPEPVLTCTRPRQAAPLKRLTAVGPFGCEAK